MDVTPLIAFLAPALDKAAGERGVAVGGEIVDSAVVTGDGNRIGGRV